MYLQLATAQPPLTPVLSSFVGGAGSTTVAVGRTTPFPLEVDGLNFVSGSVVQWTWMPTGVTTSLSTAYTNSSQLQATIPASLLTAAGTANIRVLNPDGSLSNSLQISVTAAPAIGLSPVSLTFSGG